MLGKITHRVNKVLEWFLVILMAVNVLYVLWQVFTRFVLKNPSSFTEELARYLLIWVGLLGASYASGQKMHLAIDVVLKSLEGRTRDWAELGIQLFIFLFSLFVMVIGGFRLVAITLKLNQISAALQIQLGYVYLVLPLSGLLIMFYASLSFMERLRGKTENSPGHQSSPVKEG
jgi:TRAP-type C4-dicarboxylate transport system permease small subunit